MAQPVAEQLSEHSTSGGQGHAEDPEHAHNPHFWRTTSIQPKASVRGGQARHLDLPDHRGPVLRRLFCAYAIYRSLHPEVFVYAALLPGYVLGLP
jgi:hypothetical protein